MKCAALIVLVALAGCASEPRTVSPPGAASDAPDHSWDAVVRSLPVAANGSFGVLLLEPPPTAREAGSFGIAFDARALPPGSFVRAYGFAENGSAYDLGVASGGVDPGLFALAVPVDSRATLFLVVAQVPSPAEIHVTQWTRSARDFERQFDRPIVPGAWNASGMAELSFYRHGDGATYAHNVEVEGEPVGDPLGVIGGRITLTSAHQGLPEGLVISTGMFTGQGAAGGQRIAWQNGATATERIAPTADGFLPGYRLVGAADGPNGITLETTGVATAGTLRFEHASLHFVPASMGLSINAVFIGPVDDLT